MNGVMRALALACMLGCHPAAHPTPPAALGVTISLYGGAAPYAVVEERRALVLDGNALTLDHVDPAADLATLWIEVLDDPRVAIGQCARPELAGSDGSDDELVPVEISPVVRCRVTGGRGRHVVRVAYMTPALTARAEHAIAMTAPDRAQLVTQFAVATPRWGERGELRVFDQPPSPSGGARHELARRDAVLDGSTAIIATSPRELVAHRRWIYTGAVPSPGVEPSTTTWHAESTRDVWVDLELETDALPAGTLRVHVALPGEPVRDVDVAGALVVGPNELRVPLWIDPELSGARERVEATGDGNRVDQLTLSVANLGATPREVWVEEAARPGPHRRLTGARPSMPTIHGDVLRSVLEVAPRAIEQVRYAIEYEATDDNDD
jgi:hypothetical protein